jgi:hypothetical protein
MAIIPLGTRQRVESNKNTFGSNETDILKQINSLDDLYVMDKIRSRSDIGMIDLTIQLHKDKQRAEMRNFLHRALTMYKRTDFYTREFTENHRKDLMRFLKGISSGRYYSISLTPLGLRLLGELTARMRDYKPNPKLQGMIYDREKGVYYHPDGSLPSLDLSLLEQ